MTDQQGVSLATNRKRLRELKTMLELSSVDECEARICAEVSARLRAVPVPRSSEIDRLNWERSIIVEELKRTR